MPNPYGVPEISPKEVEEKRERGETFVLLDVREEYELESAALPEGAFELVPLSRLASEQTDALPPTARDKEAEIIVMCHHGLRSAQVTAWLQQQGWNNVVSMEGGIDAFAEQVDPGVGRY